MRPPARIDDVLAALRDAWLASPDLRLGQLIVNDARPSNPCPEICHMEDELLLRGLSAYRELVVQAGARRDGGAH